MLGCAVADRDDLQRADIHLSTVRRGKIVGQAQVITKRLAWKGEAGKFHKLSAGFVDCRVVDDNRVAFRVGGEVSVYGLWVQIAPRHCFSLHTG